MHVIKAKVKKQDKETHHYHQKKGSVPASFDTPDNTMTFEKVRYMPPNHEEFIAPAYHPCVPGPTSWKVARMEREKLSRSVDKGDSGSEAEEEPEGSDDVGRAYLLHLYQTGGESAVDEYLDGRLVLSL